MKPEDGNNEFPPSYGLTIGFIGSVITTIGYIIETFGEGIELSQTIRDDEIQRQAEEERQRQMLDIQSKLDFLVNEIESMKKRG